jgi:putative chitinase
MSLFFTVEQFGLLIPGNKYINEWYEALDAILPIYDITTLPRISAFISQCGHESNGFIAIKENLNYRAESLMKVWPRLFPNLTIAQQYAHNPEMIANRAYANRMGNGNEASGDGFKFCGRGLIQLTGKTNYQLFAESKQMNLEDVPSYLATFEGAVESACWYWNKNNLNKIADAGDIVTLTKKINGGILGLDDRTHRYNQALSILTV